MIAIKVKSTNRSGEGGEELLCDPGSELRPGGREKRRAKTTNGINGPQHVEDPDDLDLGLDRDDLECDLPDACKGRSELVASHVRG